MGGLTALRNHCLRIGEYAHKKNVDPKRTPLNHPIIGTGDYINDMQPYLRFKTARGKRNLQEVVLSASPEFFRRDDETTKEWEIRCRKFPRKRFQIKRRGGVIVSAIIHLDEQTPHIHCLLLPLARVKVHGKEEIRFSHTKVLGTERGKFFGPGTFGTKYADLETEYAAFMAPLGLIRGEEGSPAEHLEPDEWRVQQAAYFDQIATQVEETLAADDPDERITLTRRELETTIAAKVIQVHDQLPKIVSQTRRYQALLSRAAEIMKCGPSQVPDMIESIERGLARERRTLGEMALAGLPQTEAEASDLMEKKKALNRQRAQERRAADKARRKALYEQERSEKATREGKNQALKTVNPSAESTQQPQPVAVPVTQQHPKTIV